MTLEVAASHDAIDRPKRRRPNTIRWISLAVCAVLVSMLGNFLLNNPRLNWGVVADYLFDEAVLRGLRLTLQLTLAAMIIGLVLGVTLAVMRMSNDPLLRVISAGYIWIFRGTPLLVQLLLWYFLGSILPDVSLGIPFGTEFGSVSTNVLITPITAAILGLGLNEAAYMAEVVRGALLSVDKGQHEAAAALGMPGQLRFRRIILPQAARIMVPPAFNNLILMLKTTSIVMVIGLPDLLTSVQQIYARNFQQIPLLLVACVWYLTLTTVLSFAQATMERRFAKGKAHS